MNSRTQRISSVSIANARKATHQSPPLPTDDASSGTQFAVLYRGLFSISYGRQRSQRHSAPQRTSTKKMVARLTRRMKRATSAAEDGDCDNDMPDNSQYRSSYARRSENGSGGQQHGRQQDERAHAESETFRTTSKKKTKVRLNNLLDAIDTGSVEKGSEATHEDMFRDAWCSEVVRVVVQTREACVPPTDMQNELTRLMLEWRLAEQRYGPLPGPQLAVLRDMPQTAADVSMVAPPQHRRDLNLIVGLMFLPAPLTAQQRNRAICTLSALSNRHERHG